MVNPEVQHEASTASFVKEVSLSGIITRKRRPDWISVKYQDIELNRQYVTLYGNAAVCLAHYEYK